MSLAYIENKLTPAEMENIMAGSRCMEAFYMGATVAAYGATFGGMIGGSLGLCYFGYKMLTC